MQDGSGSPVDADAFRAVMGSVCTPVSVVTAMAGDRPHGTTVSAFASLSLDPPMVLVSLDRSSDLLRIVRRSLAFGLNVLHSGQSALGRVIAVRHDPAPPLTYYQRGFGTHHPHRAETPRPLLPAPLDVPVPQPAFACDSLEEWFAFT